MVSRNVKAQRMAATCRGEGQRTKCVIEGHVSAHPERPCVGSGTLHDRHRAQLARKIEDAANPNVQAVDKPQNPSSEAVERVQLALRRLDSGGAESGDDICDEEERVRVRGRRNTGEDCADEDGSRRVEGASDRLCRRFRRCPAKIACEGRKAKTHTEVVDRDAAQDGQDRVDQRVGRVQL